MLEHPDKRKTWGVKSKPGYYVGTSLENYRYYWVWMNDTKRIRGLDTVKFKHKYITNTSITTGYAIVNVSQQLTSALRGSNPPPLIKSGIYHLRALTEIFNATKEGYDDREETQATKTTAHSPRVTRSSPPPRVAKDKNLPDIVPTGTTDENDKRDTPARNTRSQSTSLRIMDKVMLSCC